MADMTTSGNDVCYNAPWHALKHAWVGRSYGAEFYQPVRNNKIRDGLQQIAQETEHDYQNLIKVLTQMGVKVDRPDIDPGITIMDFVDQTSGNIDYARSGSFTLIPRPPMQPRDSVLVVGNRMMITMPEAEYFKPLIDNLDLQATDKVASPFEFDAPMITVVGQHLIVDCRDHPNLYDLCRHVFPDRVIVPVFIGGHNDAVFSLPRPGLIVSTYHHSNYAETFPGWTVKFIENQSWNAIPDWRRLKHSNRGKWWVPDSIHNQDFADFVDSWLHNWTGWVQETVFDVNMLQINENLVIVNNYNKEMFDFFKQHAIEPVVVPFRHRFFWDGGIHCITNDIYRHGNAERYITR
jgi:hypothetical protein